MAVPPRKIRQLPSALPAKDSDVFPISQMDDQGVATTRAMTRAANNQAVIDAVSEARQGLVDNFLQEQERQDTKDAELQAQIDDVRTVSEDNVTQISMLQEQVANGSGGKNAYQLWTELPGNEGKSLSDFLESYRGATGAMGPVGPSGPMGERGEIGPSGGIGPMGPSGNDGERGEKGEKGEKGEIGSVGPQGIQGMPGEVGPKGETGSVGPVGAKGDVGATGPAGLGTITPSTPTRALNTAFRPSTTKATLVNYSVQVQAATPLLAGSATATVELLSDANATPTTVRARASVGQQVGLSVSVAITDSNVIPLSYIVPAGHYVMLKSTVAGTASASIVAQTEEALG